jgi:hypothetical protein
MRLRFLSHHSPPPLWTILMVCAISGRAQVNTICPAVPSIEPASLKAGYRLASVRWDPLLRQHWAKLVSCAHPERPAIAMLMSPPKQDGTPSVPTPQQSSAVLPVVRAGDLVRLWSQEGILRIEASGIAEGSGAAGATVPVRLLHSGLDGQYQKQNVQGIIRGPHNVEMQR